MNKQNALALIFGLLGKPHLDYDAPLLQFFYRMVYNAKS
jgi:hypothetical protein